MRCSRSAIAAANSASPGGVGFSSRPDGDAPGGQVAAVPEVVVGAGAEAVVDRVEEVQGGVTGEELDVRDRSHPVEVPAKRTLLVRCTNETSFAGAEVTAALAVGWRRASPGEPRTSSAGWRRGGPGCRSCSRRTPAARGLLALTPALVIRGEAMPSDPSALWGWLPACSRRRSLGADLRGAAARPGGGDGTDCCARGAAAGYGRDRRRRSRRPPGRGRIACALAGAAAASWVPDGERPPLREALIAGAVAGGAAAGTGRRCRCSTGPARRARGGRRERCASVAA